VGCNKVDYKPREGTMKLTQPVLLQSFTDEFELPGGGVPMTPAVPGRVLQRGDETSSNVEPDKRTLFRKGTGKLIHMMKWTRPETSNAVRDLTRCMSGCTDAHVVAMKRVSRSRA
jgi:hypothetical protein